MATQATEAPAKHRRGVSGGACLRYTKDAEEETRLTEQWVRPPLHLAKAYHEDGWEISLLTSPTAGLLDGDLLKVDVTIASGASAALISPAACRVHTMESGHATIQQHYIVEQGAILDVWPAPLILQKNAHLRQSTRLDVAGDATVLFCEVVSPGRAAFGEAFSFKDWRSKLKIYRDGTLVAYENFSSQPARGDLADWRALYPSGTYAGFYYLTPEPLADLIQTLHELDTPDAMIGASPLREGGCGIKILAADGVSLRKTIALVRNQLLKHCKRELPSALRRAQTFFN